MIGLLAVLLLGCAIAGFAVFGLYRMPSRQSSNLQVVAIQLSDFMEFRALSFKNFPILFSDSDWHILRTEPRLVQTAKHLRTERRRLALRWLAAVQSDVLALWRLRRLLVSFGVSEGSGAELTTTIEAILIVASISAFRICVFVFGPFAFQNVGSWSRKKAGAYTRSCQTALERLPRSKWPDFSAEWRQRHALAG
jgi:hypothetical protein